MKRLEKILQAENIEYDKKVLAAIIKKHFPDFRRVLNELQRYSVSGKIDTGILVNITDDAYTVLFSSLKDKKFNEVRKWTTQNASNDSVQLFSFLFNKLPDLLEPKSIPELVLILGECQASAAIVANQEINNMMTLTKIMQNCSFK